MAIDSTNVPEQDLWRPLRYMWRVPLLLLHIVLGIGLCVLVLNPNRGAIMRDGHEPLAHRLERVWARWLLAIFGLRARRFGQPLADPALFVANHTSWLDIVSMHSQRAVCFVAKAEIAHWPLVGWMAASGGTIFHRRGNNHSLALVMQTMVERLHAGRSVAVFPEGGTSHDGVPQVFHARIFQTALDADVPVQPVALRFARHGRRVLDGGFRADESFMANLVRLLGAAPMDVEVHFLGVVPASPNARRHMAEQARVRIATALEADTPPAAGRP
ncbi:MAG TPA: lysophospholipid acyltransferase family protein [Rhodanobacter sp.]|nr:lysophospholipid acyltransferase family protein [Rhodanobacter sp.]